jgi:integrase/recombinase XerD
MVIASLPEKYSLLAETLYYTAGRVSEISSLRVSNIHFEEGMVVIEKSSTKTKQTRYVPIPKTLLRNLDSWIRHNKLNCDNYIFFTNSRNCKIPCGSRHVTTQAVDNAFRHTFDYIGIKGASTHSFRRSRLTNLHVEERWSLREIMDISGHKNLLSLQQYLDTDKNATFAKYRQLFEKEGVA